MSESSSLATLILKSTGVYSDEAVERIATRGSPRRRSSSAA